MACSGIDQVVQPPQKVLRALFADRQTCWWRLLEVHGDVPLYIQYVTLASIAGFGLRSGRHEAIVRACQSGGFVKTDYEVVQTAIEYLEQHFTDQPELAAVARHVH